MTESAFLTVAEALKSWPAPPSVGAPLPAPYQRLLDAAALLSSIPGSVGPRDLVALVRHVLRFESEAHGSQQHLLVPASPPWPSPHDWRDASCTAMTAGGHLAVAAAAWRPAWADGLAVGEAAEAATPRRSSFRADGDPFLPELLGASFNSYTSPGQKQAMRTVLSTQTSATVIVNLPTGSGKSAVAIAPALLHSRTSGTSVFVVPTTSLALDQERAAFAHLRSAEPDRPHPDRMAYYSGQDEAERAAIRARVRDGSQRLVFTSPESLLASLAPAVYAAVRSGEFRYFIVDEAHTVGSWGVEFRPEFQALSGLRRDLLRTAELAGQPSFRTVLMSATLTQDDLDTLVTLFGAPGPVEYVASVAVRPEPEYWIEQFDSQEARDLAVIDAVRHLPRPAIVYVSLPDHAERLAAELRRDGLLRVEAVTGRTSPDARRAVISRWRGATVDPVTGGAASRTDVVVGTSAFGLGVDQADVRSVLHACMPETIDRYYQEVGRGGRDGRAAVALMLYSAEDRRVAEDLSMNRVIGVELGLERWSAMHRDATRLSEDRYRVSLDARRGAIVRGSRENEAWNLRTLSLMMRAGLIRLDAEPPPAREDAGDDRDEAFSRYVTSSVVEVVHAGHLDPQAWETLVEPTRRRVIAASTRAWNLLDAAISDERDLGRVFADAYRIGRDTQLGSSAETLPRPGCAGCLNCRRDHRQPYAGHGGFPEPVRHPEGRISSSLIEVMGGPNETLLITIDARPMRRRHRWPDFVELVMALVRHGIRLLSAPPSVQALADVRAAHHAVRDGYFFLEPNPPHLLAPKVPSVIVHDPMAERAVLPAWYFRTPSDSYPRIIMVPPDARDPERPDQLVTETRYPNLDVNTVLGML
jgi:ATP-dependent DNA helicase RecQ